MLKDGRWLGEQFLCAISQRRNAQTQPAELISPNWRGNYSGIKFVGINPENGQKLLLTVCAVVAVFLLRLVLRWLAHLILGGNPQGRVRFWTRPGITLVTSLVLTLTVLSIWFDDPTRLTTALGLVTAGLAFALQKVITSFAGYFVILRGNNFSVGDRISMGGVRGDVIALGFIRTRTERLKRTYGVERIDLDPTVFTGSPTSGSS